MSDFGCVVMIEPVGFDALDLRSERNESRMTPKILACRSGSRGFLLHEMGKT